MSLFEMARYLHAQGHSVFVAMPPSSDSRYKDLLRPFVVEFLFVPLMPWNCLTKIGWTAALKGWMKRIWKSKGAYLYSVPRLLRFIRRHRIDLVHTNTIMALDGALAAKWAGVPHIQHLREVTGYRSEALFSMIGQSCPRTFKKAMGWLHQMVVVNSKYLEQTNSDFFPKGKMSVIYNIVEAISPEVANRRPPRSLALVANVTSTVKNHHFFVEIASAIAQQSPDLQFFIFGKTPAESDPYLKKLRIEVAAKNLSNRLFFKGICTDHAAMYAQIGVLVHTYAHESFGRIFIEAMAHGVPVVAARGGGANELISNGENGFLFEIEDLETAANQVRALCEDRQLYARIVKNGQTFARQFHSDKTGAALLKIYQETLA